MKDYSESIAYLRQEMTKQTEPHQKPYVDAIEAMEIVTPAEPVRDGAYLHCPRCGKEYTYRNRSEIKRGKRICNACGQHMVWGEADDNREKM